MKRPHLHLIRGLPGSGKTTIALTKWVPLGYAHFENDMFFALDGAYIYIPSLVHEARWWCQRQTLEALEAGRNVVVCNTFLSRLALKPYYDIGRDENARITVEVAIGRYPNTHGISEERIRNMELDWQD